jgi:IS5 family transposase
MVAQKAKARYKVTNWSDYTPALIARGSLTLWFSEDIIGVWLKTEQTGQKGHPHTYTDAAIECMLILKSVFRLALRQTQGMMGSLMSLIGIDLPVPHYTTLSRRTPSISVRLPRQRKKSGLHVVVDSTGLKVYGEGEWKVRKHGKSKRRTWRKVHLGFDEKTGEVMTCVLTEKEEHDKTMLPALLNEVTESIEQVSADGGYDFKTCYDAIAERGASGVIPPRKSAILHNNGFMDARDENLKRIQEIGRQAWKQESGYHRRSLAETGIYRLKHIFGGNLTSKKMESQIVEARLRCKAMNLMTSLGMPATCAVA